VKLDKKGRPFVACTSCGTMIFSRGGTVGILAAVESLRLLEQDSAAAYVRQTAYSNAAQGDAALLLLLRPVSSAAAVAAPAVAPEPAMRVASNG